MASSEKHILKSSEVKMKGQFTLSAGQDIPKPANTVNTASVPVEVRIVENQPDFAVIEVTCSCGTKTNVRCQYPSAESA